MMPRPLTGRLFHDDRMILVAFALYGWMAGGMAYVWWASPRDFFPTIYFYMNMPAMLMLAFIDISFGNPLGFLGSYPLVLIPLYAALWFVIGLAVYGIVRMLRLGL